jgi:hypothetical protein
VTVADDDPARWSNPAWRAGAEAWLDARLAAAGAARTGPVEQPRVRPWATLLRAPTTRGVVWLKAGGPATRYEAALYEVLAATVPERILVPIAVDAARGWVVLPDGGASLGERLAADALTPAMCEVLPRYAALQRDLAPSAGRLLGIGMPDMRPAALPERFEQALVATDTTDPRLTRLGPDVAAWSEQLAAGPVPLSIDHNDLHARNVLGQPAAPRLYDWGDAVVAHPFASMLVPLAMASPPDAARLRDAYLEPWTDLAPRAELAATLELACRLAKIACAHTWLRAVGAEPGGRWAAAPLRALASLLEPAWHGGASASTARRPPSRG